MRKPEIWTSAFLAALVALWTRDFSENHLAALWHAFVLGVIFLALLAYMYYAWSPHQMREPGWREKNERAVIIAVVMMNLVEWALAFGPKIFS